MKFIVLLLLFLSCSPNNYSVHERNMQLQHKAMIKQDLIMKGKMTKLRKQGVRSYSKPKVHKIHTRPNRKFV
jgi:hypothetical protein